MKSERLSIHPAMTSILASLLLIGLTEFGPSHGRTLSESEAENVVSFYASVTGASGIPIDDLKIEDFQVYENNKPQKLASLVFEKSVPISVGVLVDISRTMTGERIGMALELVKALAEKLSSPDELFVFDFSEDTQEIVDYVSPEDYLDDPLKHLSTGGPSRTGLAVDLGLIKLREARNPKRVLFILSTGLDIAGPATLDHIARFRYPIFALGLKGGAGLSGTLARLKSLNVKGSALKVYAEHSGGNALFVESMQEARRALDQLVFDFKNQYRLEYVSSNAKRDGKVRKIEVKIADSALEVRFLKKYQAPRH
ncbi:MAG: VWA domain-containing protein [Acidobacteriota bacterium]